MNQMVRKRFVMDDDCHWYMILESSHLRFRQLMDTQDWDLLAEEFDQFRTEHPSTYTFERALKDD